MKSILQSIGNVLFNFSSRISLNLFFNNNSFIFHYFFDTSNFPSFE